METRVACRQASDTPGLLSTASGNIKWKTNKQANRITTVHPPKNWKQVSERHLFMAALFMLAWGRAKGVSLWMMDGWIKMKGPWRYLCRVKSAGLKRILFDPIFIRSLEKSNLRDRQTGQTDIIDNHGYKGKGGGEITAVFSVSVGEDKNFWDTQWWQHKLYAFKQLADY